jgi:HlyD family secretion protein
MDTKIVCKTNKKKVSFNGFANYLTLLGIFVFSSATKRSLNVKKVEITIKTVKNFLKILCLFRQAVPLNSML